MFTILLILINKTCKVSAKNLQTLAPTLKQGRGFGVKTIKIYKMKNKKKLNKEHEERLNEYNKKCDNLITRIIAAIRKQEEITET